MKRYILLILTFIICGCSNSKIDTIEIEALILQDMIYYYQDNNKENVKIINIKFETSKDDERFNAVVSKVNHHNIILRLKEYKDSEPDPNKAFVDDGKRMIYFKIFNAHKNGKTINVNVTFQFNPEVVGVYKYIIEFDGAKYKIIKQELLFIS